jgi:hypothetical protein
LFGFSGKLNGQCTHTISLYDTYGDGWNGGVVDVYVNGIMVLDDITLASGSGPANFTFDAALGDAIQITYVAGSWGYENYYDVSDGTGALLADDWYPDSQGVWNGSGNCSGGGVSCDYNVPYSGNNSITASSGFICDHAGWGTDYSSSANGLTVINPVSAGNMVVLSFTHFDTESGYDYVRVYDGSGTGGTQLWSGSGTALPMDIFSTTGPLTIQFTSDGSVVRQGFRAQISNTAPPPPSCDYNVPYTGSNSITASSGFICDHAGWGTDYSNSANGYTVINAASAGDLVRLNFTHFALEGCCDYVRVFDGTGTGGTELWSGFGTTLPPEITSTIGPLTIQFTSDGSVVNQGFRAQISNIAPPLPSCNYNVPYSGSNSITTSSGFICDHAGWGTDYANSANGYTVINAASAGDLVRLNFTHFALEGCCDYVRVFDGNGTGGTELWSGFGTTLPPEITSTIGPLTIQFTSDVSVVNQGFRAQISNIAPALPGEDCSSAQDLATLTSPYSATTTGYANDFSFCSMGSSNDRIFFIDVPDNYIIEIWQSSNDYDSRHTMRYGGACPGTTEIGCIDDPDETPISWTNTTGSTQRVWWINAGYGSGSGNFTLNWTLTQACTTPGVPNSLSASATGLSTANISWSAGSPVGSPTLSYYWEVRTTGGTVAASGSTTNTSASVTGLTCGTTYNYRVYAETSCNGTNSAWSGNSANFTTQLPSEPTAVTATPSTICIGNSSNLNATSAGNTIYWYTQSIGGTEIGSSGSGVNFLVSPALTTTYYAEAISGGGTTGLLTTTFAAGNGAEGNMFDITILQDITLTTFDIHAYAGTENYEVYYKIGSYVGFETNSGAWTLIGSANNITGNAQGTPTPLNLNLNLQLSSGQTYSFYITCSSGNSIYYTDGTAAGSVYTSNSEIQFREGVGKAYPYGSTFSPRIWNGNIHYTVNPDCASATRIPVTVTVTPNASAGIVSAGTTPQCIGETTTYTVSGVELGGGTGSWSSSNSSVATVNASTGVVTAQGNGTCNIIYTVTSGCGGTTSSQAPYTVTPNASAGTVLAGTTLQCIGETTTYTVSGVELGGGTGSWSSSNTSIATVNPSTGLVTAIGDGTCNIVYTVTGGCNGTPTSQSAYTVYPNFNVGEINSSGETICYGGDPGEISSSNPASGGDGSITYEWRANGTPVGSSNSSTYDPPAGLTATTTYTRWAHDGTCNTGWEQSTNSWTVSVLPEFSPGNISGESDATVCYGYNPALLTANPSGGAGTYNYQWQSSTNGGAWTSITGASSQTYNPGAINLPAGSTYAIRVMVNPTGTPDCGESTASLNTYTFTIESVNPSITCPSHIALDANENCEATGVNLGTPITSDNCAVETVENNHPSTTYPLGTTHVTWTVTDYAGNAAQCIQNVSVYDNEPPTITCPADVYETVDGVYPISPCSASGVDLGTPLTDDNCGIAGVINDAPPGNTFLIGETIVTYTIQDNFGNTATCQQTVIITDDEPVVVTQDITVVLSNVTNTVSISVDDIDNGSSDNCGIASRVLDKTEFTCSDLGVNTVILTVTDNSDNSSFATASVTVLTEDMDIGLSANDYLWLGRDSDEWNEYFSNWLQYDGNDFNIPVELPNIANNVYIRKPGTCSSVPVIVNADLEVAECNTLIIETGNVLNLLSGEINIYGDFVNEGTFNAGIGTGTVIFNGAGLQTITSGGSSFYNVEFNNTFNNGADILITEPMQINGQASFIDGIVYFGATGSLIFGDDASSNQGTANSFVNGMISKTGSSAFTFPTGDVRERNLGSGSQTYKIWAPFSATPTEPTTVDVEYLFTNDGLPTWWYHSWSHEVPLNHTSDREYWLVNSNHDLSSISLHWKNSEGDCVHTFCAGGDIAENNVSIAYWDGIWKDAGGNAVGTNDEGLITNTQIIPFSGGKDGGTPIGFGGKDDNNPLPIDLIHFEAICNNAITNISWSTATEINNDYFILEKSRDAVNWFELAKIDGAGFSNSYLEYSLIDNDLFSGDNYYRLTQVDYDGTWETFKIIQVNCDEHKVGEAKVLVFPNPFHSEINIFMDNINDEVLYFEIYDELGKLIHKEKFDSNTKISSYSIRVNDLVPAIYYLRVVTSNHIFNNKIIKQ